MSRFTANTRSVKLLEISSRPVSSIAGEVKSDIRTKEICWTPFPQPLLDCLAIFRRMEKSCIWCGQTYIDKTKRKVGKTCSKSCAMALGVQKRKDRGSYIPTKEHIEKTKATLARLRACGKLVMSEENRETRSKRLKEAWASGDMREKTREANLAKYGVEHHMKTDEHRQRNSDLHSGKKVTSITRRKLSLVSRQQNHRFSRCRGGFREDLGMYFRSSWEANYARYLNHSGVRWQYESVTYEISDTISYTPDFILEDGTVVEIKGWLTSQGKRKLNGFRSQYPSVRIRVIDRKEYRRLFRQYSNIIPYWEKVPT